MEFQSMDRREHRQDIEVSEFLDVSITEMLILMYLMRNEGSLIVRKSLLDEINANLGGNKISTSSYYHKLDRLETQGLVKFDSEKKHMTTTALTSEVMSTIRKLTVFASADSYMLSQELIPEFAEAIKIEKQQNILIVYLEEGIDVRITNLLADFGEDIYVLASDESFERYKERGATESILQTRYNEGKIREADNYFEAAIVLGYECNREFNEHSNFNWLVETSRVVKPGGIFIVSGVEELPPSNHFLAQNFFKELRESLLFKFINLEDVEEDLYKLKIQDVQVFSRNGVMVIYGKNP